MKSSELIYRGQVVSIIQLEAITGVKSRTLNSRWVKLGRPKVIDESMVCKPIRNLEPITLDGAWITMASISRKFGIETSAVRKKIALYGRNLSSVNFAGAEVDGKITFDEDLSPGHWERKNLPNAGANGFSKVEVVNSSCLGMLGPMPTTGDLA